jgi:NADPH:quinone reductase-like Zn-dependent oxidoreductase
MRAVQITTYGGPEVLSVNDAPAPVAGPGQLLVKVAAAGVNPVDWKIREGYMKEAFPLSFPATLGNEIAGTVAAIGDGVEGFAVGDAVHGSTGPVSGFADLVAISASSVARKPEGMSMVEAAALPVAVATSMPTLDAGGVGAGTRVLVHAASGGVGSILVQLARHRGAEVTGLASPDNIDFLRSLGVATVVDRTSAYEQEIGGFDVVVDAFGPQAQERSWGLLKPGGILVSIAAPPPQDVAQSRGVRATMAFGAPNGSTLAEADRLFDAGQLKITIARTYPVERAAEALADVQKGLPRGKVVLTF